MLFIGFGYYYIESQNKEVKNEIESVPYYTQLPDNKGLYFKFKAESVYTYLDFKEQSITLILNPEDLEGMGYKVDYTLDCGDNIISEVCNYFDGINLMIDAETLRYSGSQVLTLLSKDNSKILRKNIAAAVFEKVEKQGIGIDFFNMLIIETKTNLKMPDCYFWAEFLDDMAKNINFMI